MTAPPSSPEASADDVAWMRIAIAEAQAALAHDDVPVGAIVTRDGETIARARNRRQLDKDPTAHAERLAITQAAAVVGDWRLERCTLYVTLEPCAMCAGAIVLARIPRVVFGAFDPKAGAAGSVLNVLAQPQLNHRPDVLGGVLADECGAMLTKFFRQQRALGKK